MILNMLGVIITYFKNIVAKIKSKLIKTNIVVSNSLSIKPRYINTLPNGDIHINFSNMKLHKIPNLSDYDNKIVSLDLSFNLIENTKGLEELTNLKKINLNSNKIKKLEGFGKLTNLQILMLLHNKIKKIDKLDNLDNLNILNLYGNKIVKITGLDNLTKLKELVLSKNKIEEISGLHP